MVAKDVVLVARLPFGAGVIGRRRALNGPEAESRYAAALQENTRPLVIVNSADCGDERKTIRLADGTTDPEALKNRVAWQLFGGLGIATTKAAVAANASYLQGAKNFKQAYEKTVEVLTGLGYEEGGHQGCGASAGVESSVAKAVTLARLSPAVALFTGAHTSDELRAQDAVLQELSSTKSQLLTDGFYGGWDPAWHADFVSNRFPENFSFLAEDPDDHETHGHNASGIYVVTEPNYGFAKNAMIESTGFEAFAVTPGLMKKLAHELGANQEERVRIELGFYDDTLHVGNGLVTEGIPVFA